MFHPPLTDSVDLYNALRQGDRLFDPAREAVSIGTFAVPGSRVKIVPAMLGGDVSLAGAYPLIASRHGDPAWRRAAPADAPPVPAAQA